MQAKKVLSMVSEAESYHKKYFKRMIALEQLVLYGYSKDTEEYDTPTMKVLRQKFGPYHLPFLRLYVDVMASTLYSKNPELGFEKTRRMEYQEWDGEEESLAAAASSIEQSLMTGAPVDPEAVAILDEVLYIDEIDDMLEKQGETLTILATSYMNDPLVNFREKLNNAVQDISIHGLTYIGCVPIDDSEYGHPEASEFTQASIRRTLESLEKQKKKAITQEGWDSDKRKNIEERVKYITESLPFIKQTHTDCVHFDFVKAYDLIPDKNCTDLRDFKNSDFIAIRKWITVDRLRELYPDFANEDISYTYKEDGVYYPVRPGDLGKADLVPIFCVYLKKYFSYCIVSPAIPEKFLQPLTLFPVVTGSFYPYTALSWSTPLEKTCIFPDSDVHRAASSQMEANMIKTVYIASLLLNLPRYLYKKGALSKEDKAKLQRFDPFSAIEIGAASFEAASADQMFKELSFGAANERDYNPNIARAQINQILGVSEASYGIVTDESATAASLASDGSQGLIMSKRNKLDEGIGNLARIAGDIMQRYSTPEQVFQRVGAGAVWFTPEEVDFSSELRLIAKNGSSAAANTNEFLAKVERLANLITQMPGFPVNELKEKLIEALGLDPEESKAEAMMPSLQALHAMLTKVPTVNEAVQGPQGGANTPNAQASTNALPQHTSGMEGMEQGRVL